MDIQSQLENYLSTKVPFFYFELFVNDEFYSYVSKESKKYYIEKLTNNNSCDNAYSAEFEEDALGNDYIDDKKKFYF